MQSGGYGGGVSEMQQFMVDGGCPASLFSISTSPPNANGNPSAAAEIQKFHPLAPHPHHHPPHLQAPPHFAHYGHPIPITQQLFQQTHHHHHHHPFQLFQHQHQHHLGLGLEQEQAGQENSNSPGGPQSFLAAMNFKLGVNESSGGGGGGSRDGLNEDDGILQGDDGSESRLHHHHHNPWHREEESAAAAAGNIKEPFWRPLDIDFINPNNKRPAKDKQPAAAEISSSNVKHFKKSSNESLGHHNHQAKTAENAAVTDSNYKLFSELEAICKPGGTPSGRGGCGGGGNNTNQTGSGSALTGDDNPLMPAAAPGPAFQPDNVSDTSNGGDAPPVLPASKSSSGGRKKRSKRKQQKQLSSIATFFESLVKQLMDHQETLHRKFLEVLERRDQERADREEAWRKQEAARVNREAAARAQERALAATRESAIIAVLEKITGESLVLPTKAQFQAQFSEESQKEHDDGGGNAEAQYALEPYNADSANNNNVQLTSSRRWPKAEVQALIRVRSGFETRFQESGLKGLLWEEVCKEMAAMGYSRSAKRCKEKWENINKYFRKTKDSGKKRPQHSKTCPYFHLLDQLYSTSHSKSTQIINSATGTSNIASTPPSSSNANNVQSEAQQRKDNSELLDAIVVSNEPGKRPAVEISNEDEDEEDGNEEGQGESQGDDDRQRQLHLCDEGSFHGLRS